MAKVKRFFKRLGIGVGATFGALMLIGIIGMITDPDGTSSETSSNIVSSQAESVISEIVSEAESTENKETESETETKAESKETDSGKIDSASVVSEKTSSVAAIVSSVSSKTSEVSQFVSSRAASSYAVSSHTVSSRAVSSSVSSKTVSSKATSSKAATSTTSSKVSSVASKTTKTPKETAADIVSIVKSSSFAIPKYNGSAYIAVNNNTPYFVKADYTENSYEYYSDLDSLGRCSACVANVGRDTMPTDERGSIGSVKPTGWQTVKYDCVDGKYLYNRCHLIGWQLTDEDANTRNLITGTRYLNIKGMLPFENMVADYIKETDNHVLYRVMPVFEGNNLVASGVLMEGYSVEDDGDGICFCVYCFNVQPEITINYANGNSSYNGAGAGSASSVVSSKATSSKAISSATSSKITSSVVSSKATSSNTTSTTIAADEKVWKTKTGKRYHNKPNCGTTDPTKAIEITKAEAEALGLTPCQNCYG